MSDSLSALWKRGLRQLGFQPSDTDTTEAKPRYSPAHYQREDYQYPSFAEELPYQYYDETSQLFFNDDNAGLFYVATAFTGANEKLAEQLDALLRTKIEPDMTFQVILACQNQVGPSIDRFSSQFNRAKFQALDKLGGSLSRYYKKAAREGFNTRDETKPRLTNTEVFIVVDVPIKHRSEAEIRIAFDRFKVSFEASLSALHLGYRRGDAVDLLHALSLYTQQDPNSIYPTDIDYQADTWLKYQVNDRNFELVVDERDKDHLLLSGVNDEGEAYQTAVTCLTLDKLPDEYHLWETPDNTANIFNKLHSVPCNYLIVATYRLDEHGKALGKANRKTRNLDKKSKSDYATLVAGTEEQAQQWRQFRDSLNQRKTSSCKMLYNVVLFSKPERRHADRQEAIDTFAVNGLKLAMCHRMQMPYFLASMPFCFTNRLQKDFALPMMMHHISSWNATQYLPVISDWKGQESGVLLPSLRSQFALVDPFSGFWGTNFNMALTGISGAGKSFFMQMMILTTLFDNGMVFIIDIGGSYRKLCEALGGVYLEYDNLAMNPFTFVEKIDDHIDSLVELFELLACPKRIASDEDSSVLREAILRAYAKRQTNTCVDDVQAALESLYDANRYPTALSLASNLSKYTSQAEHGRAFNTASKLDPNARFIVVDLLQIKDKKQLIAPTLLSVFSQFRTRLFESDRSLKKLCAIDEAWKFFQGDQRALEFLVEGFRTGRRHRVSFVTITQGINDYFKYEEATQLWENASLKAVFLQDREAFALFNKQFDLLTPAEQRLFDEFPEAREAGYSQVQLRGGGLKSFHRLFVDPFTLVLLSSDGQDYQAVKDRVARGMAIEQAVAEVAQLHYGSVYE